MQLQRQVLNRQSQHRQQRRNMKQEELEQNPYTIGDDQEYILHLGDTRKPTLTLRHINKLRKMRELRRFEKLQQSEFHALMYGTPAEETSPLG